VAGAERLAKLYDKVKARLTSPAGQEALADLHKTPKDPDAQASARLALKKALEADPAFQAELSALVEELREADGTVQSINSQGDNNTNIQVSGNHNQVR
jgi:hypothetical protein